MLVTGSNTSPLIHLKGLLHGHLNIKTGFQKYKTRLTGVFPVQQGLLGHELTIQTFYVFVK